MSANNVLPGDGYVRLHQIIGQREVTEEQAAANRKAGRGPRLPRPAITPVFPISRAGWYAGIKKGLYPKPVKLSERIAAWPVQAIRALLDRQAG